jgi:hypothetical protein
MNKIPVWNTIRFAYNFTMGDIGTIIGLIWAPMVAVAVLQFLPIALGIASLAPGMDPSTAAMGELLDLLFFFASLLLYAMIYVVVTRQALGLRQGPATLHFEVGRAEWRMLSAMLLCGLLLSVAAILLSATVALLSSLLRPDLFALAGIGVTLYILACFGGLIYAAVRLVFLLCPAVVAEEKVDLLRVWSLTAGNFWRAFAVIVACSAPVIIVNTIALGVIGGPGLFAPLPPGAEFGKAMTDRAELLYSHMPALIGLALILAPFNYGLLFGAAAAAYRSLVPSAAQRS